VGVVLFVEGCIPQIENLEVRLHSNHDFRYTAARRARVFGRTVRRSDYADPYPLFFKQLRHLSGVNGAFLDFIEDMKATSAGDASSAGTSETEP
jgi:hypothetical protein